MLEQTQIDWDPHEVVITRAASGSAPSRLLYVLDGNAALAALKSTWFEEYPGLVIVTIGYPRSERFDLEQRSRDYTPVPPPDWDGGSRRALERPHGGAGQFLAQLSEHIRPAVERRLGAVVRRSELWGHSYGGLFGLWALSQGGGGFSTIHAASPSLWWGNYALEHQLLTGAFSAPDVSRVALSMGGNEVSRTGERLYEPERLERLAHALATPSRLTSSSKIFDGASHGAAFELSLEYAVRSV